VPVSCEEEPFSLSLLFSSSHISNYIYMLPIARHIAQHPTYPYTYHTYSHNTYLPIHTHVMCTLTDTPIVLYFPDFLVRRSVGT
jgi:hypothetical protein